MSGHPDAFPTPHKRKGPTARSGRAPWFLRRLLAYSIAGGGSSSAGMSASMISGRQAPASRSNAPNP